MQRVSIRRLFTAILALACLTSAQAQSWPAKPVRIIVPFPPGGTTDIVARSLGAELQKMWQQPVVVENRPGAGGNIGSDIVAKSPNDGYTLLMGTVGTHAINAALFAQSGNKMPFDAVKDFVPITLAAGVPNVMVVNSKVPRQQRQRIHRVRQSAAGSTEHGVERQRHVDSFDGRAIQDDDGYVHGASAVSRLGAGDERPAGGQYERDVRQPSLGAAAH